MNRNTEIIMNWALQHPTAAAALSRAITEEPLGGKTLYFPLEQASASTETQARSSV